MMLVPLNAELNMEGAKLHCVFFFVRLSFLNRDFEMSSLSQSKSIVSLPVVFSKSRHLDASFDSMLNIDRGFSFCFLFFSGLGLTSSNVHLEHGCAIFRSH